jgi:[acyl-carrier-protein] S-malonyltransferase
MSKTALIFAGQGAQAVGMGRSLAEQVPGAREWFDRANAVLGYDLARICFEGPESELTRTENAQPGIYLVGWVALQCLQARVPGLRFEGTAGLSLGEFTALAAAGALSFEEGLQTVRQRGRFMQEACEAERGGMAAVIGLDVESTRGVCAEAGVELANLNCPGQIVISGQHDALTRACELAKAKGAKKAIPLVVAGAYHSRLMSSAQPKLKKVLDGITVYSPAVPVISNVTAEAHGGPEGFTRFIELGPGTALSGFMKRISKDAVMCHVADEASLNGAAEALTA